MSTLSTTLLAPFAKLLLFFYNITGSYGLALILFAFCIRLVLFPLFLKGRKGMMGMSGLADKQKELQQKYAKDRAKYSEELTKLYQQEGVKPSSGCLWSFFPLLFLMPLYAIVRRPLTYLMGMTEDTFNAVSMLIYGEVKNYSTDQIGMAQDVFDNYDLVTSTIPELANMPKIDFTFLGINLADTPTLMFWKLDNWASWAVIGLWLIPIISAGLNVVSMIVTNHVNSLILGKKRVIDQTMKSTMIIMPLFSLWICFTLPGAMGIYWIANSVFAIIQEYVNVPFLRKYLKQQNEQRVIREAEEKERQKQEHLKQKEAKKKAEEEKRRIQMERKLNQASAGASRVGIRAYARGRTYDPDRYPTYPYEEPLELAKAQWEKQAKLAEERKANKGKKPEETKAVETEKPAEIPAPETAAETSPENPVETPAEQNEKTDEV